MTAKTTFSATATIEGVEYTNTRTSARPYTHAAWHKGTTKYFATFHASEANAVKSGSDKACGPVIAIVEVTEVVKTTKRAAKVETPAEPVAEAPKAPAKRVRKAAAPKVDPALAEIVTFVLGGAHTAKVAQNKAFLEEAAVLLKNGETEAARKVLYPLRTRVALRAVKMIKAL